MRRRSYVCDDDDADDDDDDNNDARCVMCLCVVVKMGHCQGRLRYSHWIRMLKPTSLCIMGFTQIVTIAANAATTPMRLHRKHRFYTEHILVFTQEHRTQQQTNRTTKHNLIHVLCNEHKAAKNQIYVCTLFVLSSKCVCVHDEISALEIGMASTLRHTDSVFYANFSAIQFLKTYTRSISFRDWLAML